MNKYQEALDRIGRNYYLSQESGDFEHFENLYLENKETLQALIDRETPMKILRTPYGKCPICSNEFTEADDYCGDCGQALDWSKDE